MLGIDSRVTAMLSWESNSPGGQGQAASFRQQAELGLPHWLLALPGIPRYLRAQAPDQPRRYLTSLVEAGLGLQSGGNLRMAFAPRALVAAL